MVNRHHHLEDEDIELIAREARRVLGIEFVPSPDMLTAVFKAVHLRLIKNYVRVPDADMPDDLAAFDPDNGLLSLQESTFVAANEVVSCPPQRTRARFTIAHEFGHVLLLDTREPAIGMFLGGRLSGWPRRSFAMNVMRIALPAPFSLRLT